MPCRAVKQLYENLARFGPLYSKKLYLNYSGEVKDLSEVAVVSHDAMLYIVSVNGDRSFAKQSFVKKGYLYTTGQNQLHLLPGTYDLEFCFYVRDQQLTAWCTTTLTRRITLDRGSMTFFTHTFGDKRNTWSVNQSDLSISKERVTAEFKEMLTYEE